MRRQRPAQTSTTSVQFTMVTPLLATQVNASVSGIVGVSLVTLFPSGLRPVTGSCGAGTLRYAISPALPTGLVYSTTTGCGDRGAWLDRYQLAEQAVASGAEGSQCVGLVDMHGNIFEFLSDWFVSYTSADQTDPTGPATGSDRVPRGGTFNDQAVYARSSQCDLTFTNVGFKEYAIHLVRNP